MVETASLISFYNKIFKRMKAIKKPVKHVILMMLCYLNSIYSFSQGELMQTVRGHNILLMP